MALDRYRESTFTHDVATRRVFTTGTGPAVVVVHEAPGITPRVAQFGERVAAEGLTAILPSLFGTPGQAPSALYSLRSLGPACVSREFLALAKGRTSPVIEWLRALARSAHVECGGPGVGMVGMCFTGGFALGCMVDAELVAPVLSQPSLPLGLTRGHKRDLHLSAGDLEQVKARVADGCAVLGLRFSNDRLVPAARFERLREELGEGFIAVEIDSLPGNPHGIRRAAHSVLTEDLVDEPGHPTHDALHQVLAFLCDRLQPTV